MNNKVIAIIVAIIALLAAIYGFNKISQINNTTKTVDTITNSVKTAAGGLKSIKDSATNMVFSEPGDDAAAKAIKSVKAKAKAVAKRAGSVQTGQKASDSITVASLDMVTGNAGGWVAVQELKAGVLGNVLGATRVSSGVHSNVIVKLSKATVAGNTYAITHYADNGDKKFSVKTDRAVLENDGKQTMSTFVAK